MPRIVIIGTSGSGKTTLARAAARILGIPHAELDALHWGPNWTPNFDFPERVREFINAESWVIDGGYGVIRPMLWLRADTIVWLDYPMTLTFTRVFVRTMQRWWDREVLWNGNREKLWSHFFTNDSLLLWVINSWRKHRRDYPRLFQSPEYAHTHRIRVRSPAAAEKWLASLNRRPAAAAAGSK